MQIHPFQEEVEKIFAKIQRSGARTVAITSANREEGVSSLSQALTHRILLAGRSVLLVDLNVMHSATSWLMHDVAPGILSASHCLASPEMLCARGSSLVFMGVRVDPDKALMNLMRQPDFLKKQMGLWLEEYEYIVVDTPALLDTQHDALAGDIVAGYCEACLLVVLSCSSSDSQVVEALRKLADESANVIGCVLNDQINPSLKDELIRELGRLPSWLKPAGRYISDKLSANRFLSLEI